MSTPVPFAPLRAAQSRAHVTSLAAARARLAETRQDDAMPEDRGWCGAPCNGSCAPDGTRARARSAGPANFGVCPICGKQGSRGLACLACTSLVRSGERRVEFR
jgi:hypothetical protein